MARNPTFPFFYSDWLGSTTIALMSCAEEGAYVRLLCHQWADPDCSLPTDDRSLAILSRLGDGWLASSAILRGCFPQHPRLQNRLASVKLLDAWVSRQEWAEKSSRAGKRSGKVRRAKHQPTPEALTQPPNEPSMNQAQTTSEPSSEAPQQPSANQPATKHEVSITSSSSSFTTSSAPTSTTAKEEKETTPKVIGRGARASKRAPSNFILTDERLAEGLTEGLDEAVIRREFAKFMDCEFPKAHTDWDAVWRNWLRRYVDQFGGNGRPKLASVPGYLTQSEKTHEAGKVATARAAMADKEQLQ